MIKRAIKNCLGKNSKTFREIKHQQRERGGKRGREGGRREDGKQGGKKGWREGEKRERGRGKGRMAGRKEECAKDNETHKNPNTVS